MSSWNASVDLATIAGEDRETGCEPTTRAGAGDGDARRVDAQLVGVLRGPQQARVAVVERRRVRVLRREPVLDRHRDAVELLDPAVEPGVDGESGAEQVATAVDPETHGRPVAFVGGEYTRTVGS